MLKREKTKRKNKNNKKVTHKNNQVLMTARKTKRRAKQQSKIRAIIAIVT